MKNTAAVPAALLVLASALFGAPPARVKDLPKVKDSSQALFESLRRGDLNAAKCLLDGGAAANARNEAGETPLMYAALYSDAAAVKTLLERGADVNAASAKGVTALMFAVDDARKVRLLVEKGADVNARSLGGRTPLMIAASRYGSSEVVRFLLSKGAEVNVVDKTFGPVAVPIGSGNSFPLMEAAKIDEPATLRWLLEQGAEVDMKDRADTTPLAAAVLFGHVENVKLLLAKGANVNAANKMGYTPLIFAAIRGNLDVLHLLLAKSAAVNAQDKSGSTALMWAAYSEYGDPKPVEMLLKAGANPDIRNNAGETARSWALRRGNTAAVKLLGGPAPAVTAAAMKTGPAAETALRDSVEKAIAAIQASQPPFIKVSGCVSCHHQFVPSVLLGEARQKSLKFDEKTAEYQVKATVGMAASFRDATVEMSDAMPDLNVTGGYALVALAAEKRPADRVTDAVVLNLAAKQMPDGHWYAWGFRPPIETGEIEPTALAMRALQLYAPEGKRAEFERRIAKAREWLQAATPRTNQERAFRLLGLVWSGASRKVIDAAAAGLTATQLADGGWSQLDSLASDAYATGETLYALKESGMDPGHSIYRTGLEYLRKTQAADGTWQVTTRSFPVQPYKESGFPYGNDQWVSATGTAWAALALTAAVE